MEDILEAYIDQTMNEIDSIQELFNPSKDKYKINEKIKKIISDNGYKYYYITIYNAEMRVEHGYGTDSSIVYGATYGTVNESSKIRLYGSDIKFSANSFEKEGVIRYQYRKDAKKLLSRSLSTRFMEKDDIDPQLRKYIISIYTKKVN